MSDYLSLSRAARLAEVSRAELQRRIRGGEITTFEGQVAVSDLLRVYPRVSLERSGKYEQVEQIKANAEPRSHEADTRLPSPRVLVARLKSLSDMLVQKLAVVDALQALVADLDRGLRHLAADGASAADVQGLLAEIDRRRGEIEALPNDDGRKRLLAKDTFLRIMAANVKLIPSGHDFFVEGTESILDAAVRSGLRISYGCSSGNCGECKVRVAAGEVTKVSDHDYVLSERERAMGYVLACANTAVTDVVIEAAEARTVADLPEQHIRAQVKRMQRQLADLILLQVQTPRSQTLRFMAGQRARLTLENGAQTELSIASCPCDGRNLHFSVRRGADAFSAALFGGEVSPRQMITVTGPYGEFVLEEDAHEPAVLIAFGDGMAPIKSLIEHAVSIDSIESFHLYWSSSGPEGHYLERWCRALKESLDNFHFTPLIDAGPADVMALLQADLDQPLAVRAYVAGPTACIAPVQQALLAQGLSEERLRVEAVG
jgi:CDP-4-dehydro-6-deoxyglucose reductase